jgi:tRNA(Ile2) C34 agmatinyltransferase TiaS
MSTALASPAPPLATSPAGSTFERRLEAILAEASSNGQAECPLCGHSMKPAGEERELVCGSCASRLS